MDVRKIMLIVCDGMSDRAVKSLGEKTPLEYAKTPNLDKLAEMGCTGLLDILSPGIPPGSDSAHLALFGYDPEKFYPGRGAIEALGANIPVSEGVLACRFNLTTVVEKNTREGVTLIVKDRRAGRISSEEAKKLIEYLQLNLNKISDVKVKIIPNVEHRGILVIEGDGLCGDVSDSDPHEIGSCVNKCEPLSNAGSLKAAEKTANIINEIVKSSYFLLKDHEVNRLRVSRGLPAANIILPRGAGVVRRVDSFSNVWGLKAACIAKLALYRGVARYVGMDIYDVPEATGTVNTNVEAKFKKAVELLKEYDFVFVHVKGTDSASHDKKPLEKVKMIEKIDEAFKIIIDNPILLKNTVVAVTSDHSTSSELGIHIGDPPALAVYSPDIVADEVKEFNERAVLRGGLGRVKAVDLMKILLNYACRAMEYGLKPSRESRIYRSTECTPLVI
ncbi:MAG: 2,3-bisphosphoglycerate-independent phosphoglycerate mutase [Candidatus Odinarchaeum yellowstonii]|uniref:2,3-bisphosphoglycerate-independent phosphoglycerate mutase n=1 Tax=Odinarchaeota yellowstonii (strain LCB_4) TaxID=1841599 RepID=A0AAF0D1A3_ODILC|nr:MAG: 2,3-bisphosphoglycerate-independent phosphoglycerate mutase [Candidatus Odinarchaeum yellowstonii]